MLSPGSLKDGLYPTMTRADYDAILGRMNYSRLKLLRDSPRTFIESELDPDPPDKDAYRVGRAFHVATYEPEVFRSNWCVYDGRRAGEEWDRFEENATAEGREVLNVKEHELVTAMARAVRSNVDAAPFIGGGKIEATVLWTATTKVDGIAQQVPFKSRIDLLKADGITDLKSTVSARPDDFARQAFKLGYWLQSSAYRQAVLKVTGKLLPYTIVAVEKRKPFNVSVFSLTQAQLDFGDNELSALLATLLRCRATNEWPSYQQGIHELPTPRWAFNEEEDPAALGLEGL